ncbi:IclR family transcriptional regulator [Rhodoglobus vestalii]|uniref:Glycerol operon regulatory protein n=1 Tax=Rhodoglobus vestalii TaxID=193384 RepID=A0A8H2PY13_9MICO|nr:IclR family transcriptional regulator C-terminal domain-containing protein [Rhodoglobus vestalii]TQO19869.1 IclR family transcriptional regulator [Rhodoglobus vestalii]
MRDDDVGTTPEADAPAEDFVQSLARGLAVLRVFDAEHAEQTLSEVARNANIPAAAARRFLRTLETLGYVRADGRQFALTPKVLELGFGYLSSLSLHDVVQPHLETLSRATGESASVAVLLDDEIVYVARVPTRHIMNVRITIGTRFPAFATSMGRVLLAALSQPERELRLASTERMPLTPTTITKLTELKAEIDRVATQGWSIVDGELEVGLLSVAVPIRGGDGVVTAALNVSTSATRDSLEHLRSHHLPLVLAAAEKIQQDLRRL